VFRTDEVVCWYGVPADKGFEVRRSTLFTAAWFVCWPLRNDTLTHVFSGVDPPLDGTPHPSRNRHLGHVGGPGVPPHGWREHGECFRVAGHVAIDMVTNLSISRYVPGNNSIGSKAEIGHFPTLPTQDCCLALKLVGCNDFLGYFIVGLCQRQLVYIRASIRLRKGS
jgi:hypothetical protein